MHGGTVQVHSEGPGKGSEFVLRLPVAGQVKDKGPREAAGDKEDVPAAPKSRILVVDDNRDAAESLAILGFARR
jgi:hypothetical protein